MSNVLNSEDFGLKLYNRFPLKYREDDALIGFPLKRFLQALSDGGFKYTIEDINGIVNLIDPDKVDSKVLPVLFKQYGLEIFNGIPEQYLRYLLPKLGESWSKKGSLSVVEFITSSLSGIKTSSEIVYDENGDSSVNVRLEMDYNIGDYFPEADQFKRLLENFVPFYCDIVILYSYLFYESQVITCKDDYNFLTILDSKEESGSFKLMKELENPELSAVLGEAIIGKSIFGTKKEHYDSFEDHIKSIYQFEGILKSTVDTLTNKRYNTLNNRFYTNGVSSYDIITVGGKTEVIF